jgi:hypothetical protein
VLPSSWRTNQNTSAVAIWLKSKTNSAAIFFNGLNLCRSHRIFSLELYYSHVNLPVRYDYAEPQPLVVIWLSGSLSSGLSSGLSSRFKARLAPTKIVFDKGVKPLLQAQSINLLWTSE